VIPASAARMRGTEFAAAASAATRVAARSVSAGAGAGATPAAPRSWREQHAALLVATRALRGVAETAVSDSGGAGAGTASAAAAAATSPPLERRPAGLPMGARVVLCGDAGARVAVLQFRGPVWGMSKGTWLGIEYADAAAGRCDGTHKVRAELGELETAGAPHRRAMLTIAFLPSHCAGRAVLGLRQRLRRVCAAQGR